MDSNDMNDNSELEFSDVDVYFNYAFDIGYPINPIDAARQILKTSLGQAFRNYSTGKSEIADQFKWMADSSKKMAAVEELLKELDEHKRLGLTTHLRLLRQDPIQVGKVYFNALKAGFTESSNSDEEENNSRPNQFADFWQAMGEGVANLLSLLAIHEHVDREIFFSGYLETAPFVRVGLQPFGATILGESIQFDVTLTIHRTGVAILTAFGVFSGKIDSEAILKLRRFGGLPIKDCSIPAVAINRYLDLLYGSIPEIATSYNQGSEYTSFEAEETSEFGAIFDAYRYFCIETLQGKKSRSLDELEAKLRSNHWHGYPLIFIKKIEPGFSSGTEFKQANAQHLATIVLGLPITAPLRAEMVSTVCAEDLSITDDYSLYLTEGSGTVLYYDNHELGVPEDVIGAEWVRQKFLTSVVVDMILLQKVILSTFNNQLNQATYDINQLTKLKQEYILALHEFETLGLSHYGSVHDIIKRNQVTFRINDLRRLFLTKLEAIESLIQRAEEKHRLRRERLVKILTTFIAVIFSLSASQSVVDVIQGWPSTAPSNYPDWIQLLYNQIWQIFSEHPTTIAIVLYAGTVIGTLLALWYDNIKDWSRRSPVLASRVAPTTSQLTESPIAYEIREYTEGQ